MIIGMLAFLLAAVLILLLIPIRYTVTLVRWRLTLSPCFWGFGGRRSSFRLPGKSPRLKWK